MILTFDEERHEYRLDGVRLPSVTQIIEAVGLGASYPPGPYRVRGKQVHKATELYDAGTIDQYKIGEIIRPYIESYARMLETEIFVWDKIEAIGYDPDLSVAGTTDRVGLYECAYPAVADFKSGSTGEETGLQLAAYTRMHFPRKEWRDVRRFRIGLRKDGSPAKLTEFRDFADFSGWEGAVKLYNWKQRKKAKIAA